MRAYLAYMVLIFILNALIFLTPVLARDGDSFSQTLYKGFSLICHQKTERSLCLFNDGIRDCENEENMITKKGYKFPVCSRDMAIYFFMLVGGIIFPFITNIKSKKIPPISLFIIAITPMAIDGLTQALGFRESTNLIRIITGSIAGFAIPFYLIPTLNFFIERKE